MPINEKEKNNRYKIAVRFDDSEFDCTYWEKVVDIQQKNGDSLECR